MKKTYLLSAFFFLLFALAGTSCAKYDPVLPGDRVPIFGDEVHIRNVAVPPEVSARAFAAGFAPNAPDPTYNQSADNIITDARGQTVFSGFPTAAHVSGKRGVIARDGYVYAGLSTGEVVKIASKSRKVKWTADIFKTTAVTGGSEIMDIIAPLVVDGKFVYAGGLGGAFCKLKESDGSKVWCDWIGVASPFSVYGELAFVIATDSFLYVIDADRGQIYSRHATRCTSVPELVAENDAYFVTCSGRKIEKIKI
jgi:outer membrane protein assembly factor BamB